MTSEKYAALPRRERSVFIPVLVLGLAMLMLTGFQAFQLVRERDALALRIENLQSPLAESKNMRSQLQSIAQSTAKLAKQGNENAQRIIAQLRKAGITVSVDEATAE